MSGELSQSGEVENIERGIFWTKTTHNLQYKNKEFVSHEEIFFQHVLLSPFWRVGNTLPRHIENTAG